MRVTTPSGLLLLIIVIMLALVHEYQPDKHTINTAIRFPSGSRLVVLSSGSQFIFLVVLVHPRYQLFIVLFVCDDCFDHHQIFVARFVCVDCFMIIRYYLLSGARDDI